MMQGRKLSAAQVGDVALVDGTCGVCGREPGLPYRGIVAGEIRYGCVARVHWPHLVKPSGSAGFHADYYRKLGLRPGVTR